MESCGGGGVSAGLLHGQRDPSTAAKSHDMFDYIFLWLSLVLPSASLDKMRFVLPKNLPCMPVPGHPSRSFIVFHFDNFTHPIGHSQTFLFSHTLHWSDQNKPHIVLFTYPERQWNLRIKFIFLGLQNKDLLEYLLRNVHFCHKEKLYMFRSVETHAAQTHYIQAGISVSRLERPRRRNYQMPFMSVCY